MEFEPATYCSALYGFARTAMAGRWQYSNEKNIQAHKVKYVRN